MTYDLDDRSDRARVHEQVLGEGTADDVRFYVDGDGLIELWDELVVPPSVRQAWTSWIESRRLAAVFTDAQRAIAVGDPIALTPQFESSADAQVDALTATLPGND